MGKRRPGVSMEIGTALVNEGSESGLDQSWRQHIRIVMGK